MEMSVLHHSKIMLNNRLTRIHIISSSW